MRRIFVDSSYWIALRNRQDRYHADSKRIARWLIDNRFYLVVTPFIFAETHAYFSRVPEIREMVIRDFWENPIVKIEQPSPKDHIHAIELLHQRDKTYSFADAVSFVVVDRLELRQAVSYDGHFHQFGQFKVIDGRHL